MTYISLTDSTTRKLSFYLAMEEYVARHVDVADAFFIWQVPPSVIFGRNQLIENEVNMDYCQKHGIATYRRKSGGGCVYADMGNLMLSYITKEENVNFTFNRYINMVALVLCRLGVEAQTTGRNDILIERKKVSGNAFYHIPGRSIVHGTLLYDTDMGNMVGSITPSNEKLASKGVKSVRQHITLLKEHTNLSLEQLKQTIKAQLCNDEIILGQEDIKEIEQMEQTYLSDDFIHGHNPRHSLIRKGSIEGVGHLEVRLQMKNDIIKDVDIMGDYFLIGDLEEGLLRHLRGLPLRRECLMEALPEELGDIILHLRREPLLDILLASSNPSTNHTEIKPKPNRNGKQENLPL